MLASCSQPAPPSFSSRSSNSNASATPRLCRPARAHSSSRRSSWALPAHRVTLKMPDGQEKVVEVNPGTYILDAAEVAGINLPYTCRAGACSSCAARVLKGDVDQALVDGALRKFLDDAHDGGGFVMICVGIAQSDCVIETHQEEFLY